ncbi:E3 ubiquitin-protein ligase ATL4 [Morus notabilis]|uniref:RING-type E3 ubiquitin transferase n=1 Tax=Morus notabilis TaxID=981085 RepID=W9R595_9ROSA|nr:E3 ubiquitin-protein ligase ATL4 [Morus notabilis]EXB38370.1 E3 ubiquitin-protein ligase ATL4 [Morus notabilis]
MSSSPPPWPSVFGASATPMSFGTPPPTHTVSSLGNISPSIFIIIIILAVTVIASVSLCFLLRHLNRRCLRHLSPLSSSSSPSSSTAAAAVGDSHRAISSRRVSPAENNHNSSLIEALPLFAFASVTRRGAATSAIFAADCAVCLSKFEPDDQLRLLPLCCHAFHALCVDTWLQSNQTCPLCRSPIFVSDAEILKSLGEINRRGDNSGSFRLEIGNVSRRQTTPSDSNFSGDLGRRSRSYSIGSFDYLVEEDSEVVLTNAHRRTISDFKEPPPPASIPVPEPSVVAEVASSGRSWLKEYVDRLSMSLSSRAMSFRSSGRFFSGSSRRSDVVLGVGEWDLEASRVGEEISELFRWVSGV